MTASRARAHEAFISMLMKASRAQCKTLYTARLAFIFSISLDLGLDLGLTLSSLTMAYALKMFPTSICSPSGAREVERALVWDSPVPVLCC